ncbi:H+/K+-exchanging ATPase [Blastomyces dermatitidis ATCC 26199]|nr:H+/K+-exchanging ATPase [Blastomyces dermatitidis ATCC 26199]
MSDKNEDPRVRIADETQPFSKPPRRTLHRAVSSSSMSIRSTHSRVAAPETVLPITYRSLSYNINEDSKAGELNKRDAKHIRDLEQLDWHLLSADELFRRFSTSSSQGLSAEQVARRTSEYGKNQPTPPPSGLFRKLMAYVFGGFGLLLFIGCILVFIAWKPLGDPPALANLALAIVLAAVFVIQAAFNAWQDWSSSRVMASITTMLPDECMVVRENGQEWTTATELVPGDVVKIKQGNKLPSDLRFIEVSSDAKFDRSILTGESEPAQGTVDSTDKNYLETRNIGLQGTHCVSGSATGLRRDHTDWINLPLLIVSCVSVGIAFVPEGLPVAVALSLTIGANIMKKNKILCKTLATVETLGSVSVICTDKTGNLTKNEMFATDCYTGAEEYTEEAARIANHGREETDVSFGSSMNQLRRVGGLRNAAEFDTSTLSYPPDKMKMYGDPTDQAILRFSESLGSVNRLRSDTKKVLSSPSTAGTNP